MCSRRLSVTAGFMLLSLLIAAAGCRPFQGGSTTGPSQAANGIPQRTIDTVPLGQIAGKPQAVAALSTRNPYEGSPQAVQEGKELFIRMNCAGCHAYGGKGNMGPDLTDAYWRYGGLPIQIYKTLEEGRPNGMPAWSAALPPDDLWKLVAYIQSLGGAVSVSDYQHARQGDHSNTQVAPEAQADAEMAPAVAVASPIFPSAVPRNESSAPIQPPLSLPKSSSEKKP